MKPHRALDRFATRLTGGLLLTLLAWEASGLDLALAGLAGGPSGFAWRDHWLLRDVLHGGGRVASWLLVAAIGLGVWWPWGWLTRLSFSRRLQLATSNLAAALAVAGMKSVSGTSCPWDLSAFGGAIGASSHWFGFFTADGGSGHCFPAGHASAGFAFVGGYFAFREPHPRLARAWLAAAGASGLVLGLAQQWRGAHFMSHTLWSAALCWWAAWTVDLLWARVSAGPERQAHPIAANAAPTHSTEPRR